MSTLPPQAPLLRIGVVAGTTAACLPALRRTLGQIDLLLHAGRIGGPEVLAELERCVPLRAVVASQDYLDLGDRREETLLLEAGPLRILMTHLAGEPPHLLLPLQQRLEREPVDVLVQGQPPAARAEWIGGLLVVAPGHAGVTHPGVPPTCALIEVEGRGRITAHVLELDRPGAKGGPLPGDATCPPRRLPC